MPTLELLLLASLALFGLFFVTLFSQSVRRFQTVATKLFIQSSSPPFYFRFQRFCLRDLSIESILFCTLTAQNILRIFLLFFCFITFFDLSALKTHWPEPEVSFSFFLALILFFILVLDLMPRLVAHYIPARYLQVLGTFSYPFLLLFSPVAFLLCRILQLVLPEGVLSPFTESGISPKEKLIELIQDVDNRNIFNEHDKKLLESVLAFRDRIAREVMVPRVNLFCLPSDTTIQQAAKLLQKEGYSRVPVYKGTQDHIIGVLMYKDVLTKYMEFEASDRNLDILKEPIDTIVKGVLYTPETKKISILLQDFRKKQTHLAVVVDEYGGTAGVVTIEDILEEIVGEIADEYDEQEKQFWPLQRGGWIVDGRMNLLDMEDEIGIKIPQEAEYDTVAGYIYYRLGTIPKKGVILHHDTFELEILSSDDRFVEKVKITPLLKKH